MNNAKNVVHVYLVDVMLYVTVIIIINCTCINFSMIDLTCINFVKMYINGWLGFMNCLTHFIIPKIACN